MSYSTIEIGDVQMNIGLRAGNSFYKITNIKELLSALPTQGSSTPKQADHGVDPGIRHFGPRSLPFEGEIHATSVSQRVQMEKDLRRAIALPRTPSETGNDGHVQLVIEDEAGNGLFIYAIVVEMPEFSLLYEGRETMSSFRFAMVADDDPFFYSQDATEAEGPEAVHSTTFKLQDNTSPKFQDGSLPTFQDHTDVSATVTNDGNIGSPPVITIYGPASGPVVENLTTGKSMSLSGLSLLDGERVEIDVANLTITKFDTSDVETSVIGFLTIDSQWIFIEPGDNVLTLFDDTPTVLEGQLAAQFHSAFA